MGVASLANRHKEWASTSVDNILHSVLSEKDRSGPYFWLAVAVVQQEDFDLCINNSLAIFRNHFNSLVASDYDPVVLATFFDPIRVHDAFMNLVWIHLEYRLERESCHAKNIYQPLAACAVEK